MNYKPNLHSLHELPLLFGSIRNRIGRLLNEAKIFEMELKDKLDDFKPKELLQSLFLPKLKYELDSVPIENELFEVYQANIVQNLPLLFDFVQQQKHYVYENEELQSSLILLLCELAPDTIYRISNERLLQNVCRLLDEQQVLNTAVETLIFDYYIEKLKKDLWKVHLGAVHGFVHFLAHFYNEKTSTTRKLDGKWLNFSLSVALNIRDCHENTYKQLGIKIFLIILQCARTEKIREINVHSVIYESALKDVHFTDFEAVVTNNWNCLFSCLDFFENIDSIGWCQVDDLLEILIRNIPLTNNAAMSVCLFAYVTKLCAYFTLNRTEIFESTENAFIDSTKLEHCRNACTSNTSYTIFRWAKSILEMIIYECSKLMQDVDTCLALLMAMHKCYLVAILPIPAPIAETHLIAFYEKFTAVLMEIIVMHKKDELLIKHIKTMLDTFIWQLKRANCDKEKFRLGSYQMAFEELCKNEVFL